MVGQVDNSLALWSNNNSMKMSTTMPKKKKWWLVLVIFETLSRVVFENLGSLKILPNNPFPIPLKNLEHTQAIQTHIVNWLHSPIWALF